MNVNNRIDLYTDYLIVSTSQVTATGLSALTDGTLSHDSITRLLSSRELNGKALWKYVKPMCYEIRGNESIIAIDDSIQEKPYSRCGGLVGWHYDHSKGRSVKGINFISCAYHSMDTTLILGAEFVEKGKKSKNDLYRELIQHASNNVDYKYVLNDTWYSSVKNMNFVRQSCGTHFIMSIKKNRLAATTEEEKKNGNFANIKSLGTEGLTQVIYLKGLDFPVLAGKYIFKNGDDSTGELYLVSSDLSLTYEQLLAIYQRRWKVEEYHRSVKNNTSFGKSPAHTDVTQRSHCIASIIAFIKLERLRFRTEHNHYAMKQRVYLTALKAAQKELFNLSTIKIAA